MLKFCVSFAILAIFTCCWSSSYSQRFWYGRDQDLDNPFGRIQSSPIACPATCRQDANPGKCLGYFVKWYYDTNAQKCQRFTWGGCGGNANRFDSRKLCMEKCSVCRGHSPAVLAQGSENPTCDCVYVNDEGQRYGKGCKISVAPPEGYKCQCKFNVPNFTCGGTALQCSEGENCPADCTSKACCETGRSGAGNCSGYPRGPLKNRPKWEYSQ